MNNDILEMEDINYQFERIDNLVKIIKSNYYDKNSVDYGNISDCYDLCVSYNDVSTILETIQEIASNTHKRFNNLLETKRDIKSE